MARGQRRCFLKLLVRYEPLNGYYQQKSKDQDVKDYQLKKLLS